MVCPKWSTCKRKPKAFATNTSQTKTPPKRTPEALFKVGGEGRNFRAFREQAALPAGLEGALFGRMVTSDPGANIDAAIHVAHAFTVHGEESESDYFSVVDELAEG